MTTIPIVDISSLVISSTPTDISKTSKELGDAFKDVGFVFIKGHQVPQELVERVYSHAKKLFELPENVKQTMSMTSNSHTHRGYSGFGDEVLDENTVDWKEAFDIGVDLPLDNPDVVKQLPLHGPNVWPKHQQHQGESKEGEEDKEFKKDISEYFEYMIKLGHTLLRAIETYFQLPPGYFQPFFEPKPMVLMRLLHYPPLPSGFKSNSQNEYVTCGEHSDYGALTILAADSVGLQVKDRNGQWINAPVVENSFIVNLGDMMSRWTNDVLLATKHRVLNVNPRVHRYSIPFFFEPSFYATIKCISEPAKYPETQYGPYLLSRYDATFNHRKYAEEKNE